MAPQLLSGRLPNRATEEEQKKKGWEMAVRIEKIIVTVRHEAHGRQVKETMEILGEGPESFYESPLAESRDFKGTAVQRPTYRRRFRDRGDSSIGDELPSRVRCLYQG